MKKRIVSILLLVACLVPLCAGLSSCSGDVKRLYLYNWGEYMPLGADDSEDVLSLFEEYYYEAYGERVEVVYSIFSSNEEMYAKLKNGSSKIDLIIPSDYMVERLIAEGRLAELDFENIPHFSNINERFLSPDYDTEGLYSVPYTYGLVGLIYNTEMVDMADFEDEVSWRILWDEKYKGNILNFNNSRDAFGIAQYILSYETGYTAEEDNYVNTTNPTRWDDALSMLHAQKPLVQAYVMDEVFNKMESGAAALAPYYAGDFYTMQEENPALSLVYPKEGTNIFVDAFCIPKDTPSERKLIAERFIDFALSTDVSVGGEEYNVAREIAEYICYATPNDAVALDEEYEYFEDENLYPDLEGYNTYFFRNLPSEALEYSNSLWENLKIGGGGGDTAVYIVTAVILGSSAALFVFHYARRRRRAKYY